MINRKNRRLINYILRNLDQNPDLMVSHLESLNRISDKFLSHEQHERLCNHNNQSAYYRFREMTELMISKHSFSRDSIREFRSMCKALRQILIDFHNRGMNQVQ